MPVVRKSSTAGSSGAGAPKVSGNITEGLGNNSSPEQLNHEFINILGMNLYRVCAAHLAHQEETPLFYF